MRAVGNLSLVVEPGEIVGLIGPNGAGKTTVIDAVTGFVGLTEGSLRLGGADITRKSVDARVRAGLARSFQTVEPFNDLNVAENIAVGFERVRWFDWLRTLARPTSASLDQELRAEASSLELDLDRFPDSLSQGRRRALGVLRALATRPAVLLLDEPAAGLDKDETKHLGTVLRRVAKERGIGLLLVEHDMTLVSAVCDKVVLIDFGKTLFAGSMADAFDSPIVRAAYLGEAVSAELEEGVVVTGDVRQ